MQNKFNQEDKQKVVDFLNMVANHATFNMSTNDVIRYFKLLAHMQQSILPKIESNVLEVTRVVEPEKPKRGRKK